MAGKPTIGSMTDGGHPLAIDILRLLVTRMLVQADPGGGKSWVLRRLLEQTADHVQQIILDIEGDFLTLREKYDYVICAPSGADAIANPKTAAILARRIRESRVSAIIDLYELKMQDRKRFVRLFLEELIEAPKSMWHPALVLIDEAHIFAPEKDEAESAAAVIDLTARGRKRGLCPVLATQRLSKLHKDAAAGLQNKLIGVTTLDLDVTRAAKELAMTPKDATPLLRELEPGEFYCFGPALSRAIVKVKVGAVQTTHPEPGAGAVAKPPEPSEKIKKLLAKLTDLPKEAEQEARTIGELSAENARLKLEARTQRANTEALLSVAPKERVEVPVIKREHLTSLKEYALRLVKATKHIEQIEEVLRHTVTDGSKRICELCETLEKASAPAPATVSIHAKQPIAPRTAAALQTVAAAASKSLAGDGRVSGPQQMILNVLAMFESIGTHTVARETVAVLAGTTPRSSGFEKNVGTLRALGLIDYPVSGMIELTEQGRGQATPAVEIRSLGHLHAAWMRAVSGPQAAMLQALIEIYPKDTTREGLAAWLQQGGIQCSATSSGFEKNVSTLRTLGAIDYPSKGRVRATEMLFPRGL